MKVILNVDVKSLGEEGDVKNVANGYARNFLLPRNLAVPYNEATVLMFEAKKAEIEARKEQKRKDSASLKEKLEAASKETKATTVTSSDRESIIEKDEHDNYREQKEKNNGITDDQFFDDFFFDE